MGQYKTGETVEVLDDTFGRWMDGKVLGLGLSLLENEVEIHFLGWSKDYDTEISLNLVRKKTYDKQNSDQDQVGKKRDLQKRKKENGVKMMMKLLVRGDILEVKTDNGIQEGIVHIVDPFNDNVEVLIDGEHHVVSSEMVWQKETVVESGRIRKTVSSTSKRHKRKSENVELASLDNNRADNNEGTGSGQTTTGVDVPCNFQLLSTTTSDNSKVDVGGVVSVKMDPPINVGVLSITTKEDFKDKQINGFILGYPGVKVSFSTAMAETSSKKPVARLERTSLVSARDTAFQKSVSQLKSSWHYRFNFRKQQVGFALKKEVSSTLRAKCLRKVVPLGVSSLDVDAELFGLDVGKRNKVSFSYRQNNISQLDDLLGERWDYVSFEQVSTFVTSVEIRLSRDLMLSAVIQAAKCWIVPSEDYRCSFASICK